MYALYSINFLLCNVRCVFIVCTNVNRSMWSLDNGARFTLTVHPNGDIPLFVDIPQEGPRAHDHTHIEFAVALRKFYFFILLHYF